MIGDTEHLWNRKVEYQAAFDDVSGLKPGSPVSMGGVDVGRVDSVAHAVDPSDRRIYVKLQVSRSESVRVLTDTKAQILGKGLLGDKMVDLYDHGEGAAARRRTGCCRRPSRSTSRRRSGSSRPRPDHAMTNVERRRRTC
jgi:ABC-type transporter Mla subunit MlaD